MAIEGYFQDSFPHHEMNVDESSPKKWKSVSTTKTTSDDNDSGCFECNICLDHARDPVVTLCGHLYCWPCIYKWIHFQTDSIPTEEEQQKQQCPVCKADVSSSTLVPLYGRGLSSSESEPNGKASGVIIPHRPSAYDAHAMINTNQLQQLRSDERQQHHPPNYNNHAAAAAAAAATPVLSLGGTMTHPMVWMFGEMVHARMFGNSSSEYGLYGYRNPYHQMANGSARVRRQEMKAEKSLNRISIFLFCCLVLCLLLF